MYKCSLCGSLFSEPDVVQERGCHESDCGVFSMFPDHHYYTRDIEVCPDCGSEDFDSYWEEDDDEFEE